MRRRVVAGAPALGPASLGAAVTLAVGLGACGDTSQSFVSFPLEVAGTPSGPRRFGAWEVDLDVGRVGLGPIYFCASSFADANLCGTAQAELRESVELDGLDPAPRVAGVVDAITGTHRVAIYDYAYSWFLRYTPDGRDTRGPVPTEGAPDGHSLVLEGNARRDDGVSYDLVVRIDAEPGQAGETYVAGQPAEHTVTERTERVRVVLDPTAWLGRLEPVAGRAQVDFDALAALGVDPVVIEPGLDPDDPRAEAYVAIRFAMQSPASLPTFEWMEETE